MQVLRRIWPVLLGLPGALLGFWLYQRAWPPFDLILAGGQVVDGTGREPYRADVGVRGGRIRAIGRLPFARAARRIDAGGLLVAPGFIDVHTHIEGNINEKACRNLRAPNFVQQGVTTLITGNCGASRLDVELLLKHEKCGWQVNLATMVGHNSVRRKVMNMAARAPSAAELAQMRALVETAMQQGALGLSTGLAYTPGAFAQPDEVIALARVAALYDGLYVSHIRDEAAGGLQAIQEALEVGRRARLPVHISHFKASGRGQWRTAGQRLKLVTDAVAEGLQVTLDQYPYDYSSTSLDLLFPPELLEANQLAAVARSPGGRRRVIDGVLERMRANGWADLAFARVAWYGAAHEVDGKLIPEICEFYHKPCPTAAAQAEMALQLRLRGGAQMLYHDMDPVDVDTIFSHPDAVVGTDSRIRNEDEQGRPHPRGSGAFPRVLAQYVRERELTSWGDAARRMSGLPAQIFGLGDRGQVATGYWADLVVLDRDRIRDTADRDDPLASPEGIQAVFVNGELVVWHGRETGARPGKALRRERRPAPPPLALTLPPGPQG